MQQLTIPTDRPVAVFTQGLTGSGKSYWTKRLIGGVQGFDWINVDTYLEAHPDYDPKHPEILYPWAKEQSKIALAESLAARRSYVLDGTLADPAGAIQKMRRAIDAGYYVILVTVEVPITLALYQNLKRERTVKESVIWEKAETLPRAIAEATALADAGYNVKRTGVEDPGTVTDFGPSEWDRKDLGRVYHSETMGHGVRLPSGDIKWYESTGEAEAVAARVTYTPDPLNVMAYVGA